MHGDCACFPDERLQKYTSLDEAQFSAKIGAARSWLRILVLSTDNRCSESSTSATPLKHDAGFNGRSVCIAEASP